MAGTSGPVVQPKVRARLILADDHRMVVQSFSQVLRGQFDVVDVVYDADALIELLQAKSADCLLLDVLLPGMNGLELIPRVRSLRPEIKILVVTMLRDRAVAEAALAAGADGFLPKDGGIDELALALETVLFGRLYISPTVPKTSHGVGTSAGHPALARLTFRQQQVLRLIGEGKALTEIARLLSVSESTVEFHKHNVMRALGLHTTSALAQFAVLLLAQSS